MYADDSILIYSPNVSFYVKTILNKLSLKTILPLMEAICVEPTEIMVIYKKCVYLKYKHIYIIDYKDVMEETIHKYIIDYESNTQNTKLNIIKYADFVY